MRSQGVQAEILLSLTMIVVTTTGLLTAVFMRMHAAQLEPLQSVLGRGLVAEARAPFFDPGSPDGAAFWGTLRSDGRIVGAVTSQDADLEALRALGEQVRAEGVAMLQSGPPWQATRFAMPSRDGRDVLVARIPPAASGRALLGLILADVAIFGFFGALLLRRRIIRPLRSLAEGVRTLGKDGPGTRVAVDGVGEISDLGRAFNDMSEALDERGRALEKAVLDLRASNESLVHAREGLGRAERLALVGSLSAGVAHEVGNPMGALLAFLDVVAREPRLTDRGRSALARASQQGERVRTILRQLLDFSRAPQNERTPVDLARVVEQVKGLISAQRDYVRIGIELAPWTGSGALPSVITDEGIVSQILLNLVLNAAAAVDDQETPRIRIGLRPGGPGRRDDEIGEGAGARMRSRISSVEIVVEDNGPGIDPALAERVFDPFFTTKPPGEGTGLGLANAQQRAAQLGGRVWLEAARGVLGGASFVLALPLDREEDRTPGDVNVRTNQSRMS